MKRPSMKHLTIFFTLIAGLLIVVLSQPDDVLIELDAQTRIEAGQAWTVTISIPYADAGDMVEAVLMNGLQTLTTQLMLGDGGMARWSIPANRITQAGRSLLWVRYHDYEVRHTLDVAPQEATTADLFSTSNDLVAYGESQTTVIVLPRDEWGNPANDDTPLTLHSRYPDGTTRSDVFDYVGGIGWLILPSQGQVGRVRLMIAHDVIDATLELRQTPNQPDAITLKIQPPCVLNDDRDLVTLIANVADAQGYPVVDGTLVTFRWREGFGVERTIDGRATLRLPAPTRIGWHFYRAQAGNVQSLYRWLRVTGEACPHDP